MFEALSEEARLDRTADFAIVASFLAQVASDVPPPSAIRFVEGRDADASLSRFIAATSPCQLKEIYSIVGRSSDADMPMFAEWSCAVPSPTIQASFRIREGQIEQITFAPRLSVQVAAPTASGQAPR